jgi:hypothetical protein
MSSDHEDSLRNEFSKRVTASYCLGLIFIFLLGFIFMLSYSTALVFYIFGSPLSQGTWYFYLYYFVMYAMVAIIILFFILPFVYQVLNKIICPNCLKTFFVREISVQCPACDTKHSGAAPMSGFSIFRKCGKCGFALKEMECPHCEKPIDLTVKYNKYELQRKRYE